MDPDRGQAPQPPLPDTRQELTSWVRETIPVPGYLHDLLLEAVDRIFVRHEQLWQASKQDAMRAMSQGFADQLARLKHQLAAKDATVSNLSEYFENLVSSLSEKAGRDAKTNLLNFPRFEEALVILLATERRVSRCAVGLIDIANFSGTRHVRPHGWRSDHRNGVDAVAHAHARPRSGGEGAGCRRSRDARAFRR
jgi:hypothetical protein